MTTTQNYPFPLRKLALIISNEKYTAERNRLNYSKSNAEKLGGLLKKHSFKVTIHNDLDSNMMTPIKKFCDKRRDGDLILFYYSGHACALNNKNYLIPVDDSNIEDDTTIELKGIIVENILQRLTEGHSLYGTVAILDCCKSYNLENRSILRRT